MASEIDAAGFLEEEGSPEADRQLAENFGMTVKQVQEFDPQALDVRRACKFLGLPLKRFDQLSTQPASRARWVESVAKQKKELIETFPEASKEMREMLEAIRKFALRKCLKTDGTVLAEGGERTPSRKGGNQKLLIGGGVIAAILLVGLVFLIMPSKTKPKAESDATVEKPVVNGNSDRTTAGSSSSKDNLDQMAAANRAAAEYILKVGGTVRINGENVERDKLPNQTFRLTAAIMRDGTLVSDDGLQAFRDCRDLEVLAILGSKVTQLGLANFKNCDKLIVVALSGPNIDDAALANFVNCTKLQQLLISNTKVTDDGLMPFHKLNSLVYLEVNNPAVTDRGVAGFANSTKLRLLTLNYTGVTDNGIATLQGCKDLENLYLDQTKITDKSLPVLNGFIKLRVLSLANTAVTDEGILALKDCAQFESLFLQATKITDKCIPAFTGLAKLKTLRIRGTDITESGKKKLAAALPYTMID